MVEASSSEIQLLAPFLPPFPCSEAKLRALAGGCADPGFALPGGFTGICLKITQRNPVVEAAVWGREGRAISHSSQSPSQRLLDIPPTHTISATFFVQALEPGGKRSRFPRLCTPFSRWVTKPNTLNQNLPSLLFPGPDKELVRCLEPERQKSGCAAGLFLPSGYTTPSRGFGCCTTLGHLRAEGEAEPVFPYRSLCVGKVFLCTLFGCWFFFLMFSLVLLPI